MLSSLEELEYYCNNFLAAPSSVEVKLAESVIQDYKKNSTIDQFCYVLSSTKNEFLIFESNSAICTLIINNWNDYKNQITNKIQWLLDWNLEYYDKLSHWIWSSSVVNVVKLIKKSHADDINESFDYYFEKISKYLLGDSLKSKIVGLDLIFGVLTVYSGITVSNQQLRICKDSELRNRQLFERKYLGQLFSHLLVMLSESLNNVDYLYNETNIGYIRSILNNLEVIFSWNFLNKIESMKWMILPKNEAAKKFAPPAKWCGIIRDLSLIELMFKVHDKVRGYEEVGRLTLCCMLQLSGLKCKYRHNSNINSVASASDGSSNSIYSFSRGDFSLYFVECLYRYLCNNINGNETIELIQLYEYEVSLLSDILYQLQEHLNSSVWLDDLTIATVGTGYNNEYPIDIAQSYTNIVYDRMKKFLSFYCQFAVKCMKGAAIESLERCSSGGSESDIYTETCERILSRFVSLSNFQEYIEHIPQDPRDCDRHVTNCDNDIIIKTTSNNNTISSTNWEYHIFNCFNKISQQCHIVLFQSFVGSHLSVPDGYRNINGDNVVVTETGDMPDDDTDDLDLDIIDDDKVTYESSLYSTGYSAIQCLPDSIKYLTSLLHNKLSMLSTQSSYSLLEDLHWLCSIIGYSILDVTDDALSQCRTLFSRHSDSSDLKMIYQNSKHQLQQLLTTSTDTLVYDSIIKQYQNLLIDLSNDIDTNFHNFQYLSYQVNLDQCDDIIRLFYLSLRGFIVVIKNSQSGQLVSDFIWLFNRWMIGYLQLFPDSNDDSLHFVTILAVFRDEPNGHFCHQQMIHLCLKMINACVDFWGHDPCVMEALLSLMVNITSSTSISSILIQSDLWLNEIAPRIVNVCPPYSSKLTNDCISRLITSLFNVNAACTTEQQQSQYLQLILQPIQIRLSKITSIEGARGPVITEDELIICLSLLHGVIMTKWPSKFSRHYCQWRMNISKMFDIILPWLQSFVDVIGQKYIYYSSVVIQLLQCLLDTSRYMLLEVTETQTHSFYRLNLHLFTLYSTKSLYSRQSSSSESYNKDDTIQEIKLIFSIATELLSRQVFDEFEYDPVAAVTSNGNTNDVGSNGDLDGYDVISLLIYHLAPFISSELLQIPDVGTLFFQCATLVTEFSASSFLCKMNYEFNTSMMDLFVKSLYNSNTQIVSYSLRGISSLAEEYYQKSRNSISNPIKFNLDAEFLNILKSLFDWIRSQPMLNDVTDNVSSVLIILVKYNPDQFWSLVSDWLSQISNQNVSQEVYQIRNEINRSTNNNNGCGSNNNNGSITSFRYNGLHISEWNRLISLINCYGDV